MLGSLLPFQNKTLCLFFVLSLVALCLSAQQQTPIQNKTLENPLRIVTKSLTEALRIRQDEGNHPGRNPMRIVKYPKESLTKR